jgi:hypothetical protein
MPPRKPESLHEITRQLLQECPQTTYNVAVATRLSYSWLVAFASDRMAHPSVNRVQVLYEYLSGKPLLRAR